MRSYIYIEIIIIITTLAHIIILLKWHTELITLLPHSSTGFRYSIVIQILYGTYMHFLFSVYYSETITAHWQITKMRARVCRLLYIYSDLFVQQFKVPTYRIRTDTRNKTISDLDQCKSSFIFYTCTSRYAHKRESDQKQEVADYR